MTQYVSALGVCQKCNRDKVQVEGGDTKCVFCDYDLTVPSGPVVNIPDPGEDEINKILAATGVRVDLTKKAAPVEKVAKAAAPIAATIGAPAGGTYEQKIQQAVQILQSLPMPKDIKHFKTVAGVIKKLEALLGE